MIRVVRARVVPVISTLAAALVMAAGLAPAAPAAAAVAAVPVDAAPVAAVPVAAGPLAAPKKAVPSALQVAGPGIDGGKLTIQQAQNADLFDLLLSEVSWLANATPQTAGPKADKLGRKYTVTVLVKNTPNQVYDLFPEAVGGPRAFRPEKQPTGKKTAGWFYGRLTMPEALRLAGAPLKQRTDLVTGGIGGGLGQDVAAEAVIDPVDTASTVLAEVRQLFLLNGAVLVVILIGLAGIAFLIRRRV